MSFLVPPIAVQFVIPVPTYCRRAGADLAVDGLTPAEIGSLTDIDARPASSIGSDELLPLAGSDGLNSLAFAAGSVATPVPEPSTLVLAALALAAVCSMSRCRESSCIKLD